jgi:guanylate kinase
VVAAPSGGGKTSLIHALLERDDRVSLSVSHTTRAPRPGEKDGMHYHFVTPEIFQALADQGEFLEHARVFDHRYGTGRSAVAAKLGEGFDVLLDIDWQGARQVRRNDPSAVSVFILPPSLSELRRRLTARGQDSAETIERRMRDARSEISHYSEFDHVVVNDDFAEALADLQSIIRSGRPKRTGQQQKIHRILEDLMGKG